MWHAGATGRMREPALVRLAAHLEGSRLGGWRAGRGLCGLRVAWFAGEQVDAVAEGQGDAGVGVGVAHEIVPTRLPGAPPHTIDAAGVGAK